MHLPSVFKHLFVTLAPVRLVPMAPVRPVRLRAPAAGVVGALAAALLALLWPATTAWAQPAAFPNKPIRLVIPFPPGGSTDIVGRLLARRMAEEFGQQVIVDNRAGAGGGLGTQHVVRAEPDGHTLVMVPAGPITVIPHVNPGIGYGLRDLVPLGMVFRSPFLLVVSADSPNRTLAQLLAQGKPANGAPAAYGSSGVGALSHLGSEMLNAAAGTAFLHVPYKGTPGTLQALLAGDVQWALVTGNDGKGPLEAGRLRPLAVLSQERHPLFPQVPSLAEVGLKDLELDVWFGLFAPARTPPQTVELLSSTLRKLLAEPEYGRRLQEFGGMVPAEPNTPASVAAHLERESAAFAAVVRKVGIKAE